MDPITAAIVGALGAGALAGLNDTVSHAIADAYAALKATIRRRDNTKEVVEAVESLEARPKSAGRKAVVEEEILSAGLDGDDEIVAAANLVLQHLNDAGAETSVVQQASGTGIAQAANQSTASAHTAISPSPQTPSDRRAGQKMSFD